MLQKRSKWFVTWRNLTYLTVTFASSLTANKSSPFDMLMLLHLLQETHSMHHAYQCYKNVMKIYNDMISTL